MEVVGISCDCFMSIVYFFTRLLHRECKKHTRENPINLRNDLWKHLLWELRAAERTGPGTSQTIPGVYSKALKEVNHVLKSFFPHSKCKSLVKLSLSS